MSPSSPFKVSGLSKIHEHWGDDPSEFLLQFHCEVSKHGEPGGEAFHVTVASPLQLSKELSHGEGIQLGRGYIFMSDYDERAIVSRLQTLLDGSGATSWEELAAYVTKYFNWID